MATGVSPARECAYAVGAPRVRAGCRTPIAPFMPRPGRRWTAATGPSRWRSPTGRSSARPPSTTSPRRSPSGRSTRLDPPVLAALRLGLMQVLLMDGVADHAAVHESVELAKHHARGGSGLVNAVLRRAAARGPRPARRAGRRRPRASAADPALGAGVAGRAVVDELGPERARALLAAVNEPAESVAARQHAGGARWPTWPRRLGVATHAAPGLPEGLVLEAPFDAYASPEWAARRAHAPVAGLDAVARALAPEPGERVLDLCAAPGRQDHASRRAGAATRAKWWRWSATPGRADALRRTLDADARPLGPPWRPATRACAAPGGGV